MTQEAQKGCSGCRTPKSCCSWTARSAGAILAVFFLAQSIVLAQPANDDCVNATVAVDGGNPYDNTDATLDATAPAPSDGNMQDDIWFVYTATCTGSAVIDTCEGTSGADTVLEVYDGGTCPPVVSLANADDTPGCGFLGFSSSVTVGVVSGQSYLIRLSGWNGGTVTGVLNIGCFVPGGPEACCLPDGSCFEDTAANCTNAGGTPQGFTTTCGSVSCPQPPPANDDCATATDVGDGVHPYSLSNSSLDGTAPLPADTDMENDVWFRYTASCTGVATIQTCDNGNGPDTILEIYDGGICPPVFSLGSNDDTCGASGFASIIQINVTSGNQYLIRLSGWQGSEPVGNLEISCAGAGSPVACCFPDGTCTDLPEVDCFNQFGDSQGLGTNCASTICPQPPPDNSDCSLATDIVSVPYFEDLVNLPGSFDSFNIDPSCDSAASCGEAPANNGVWYTYTPANDCLASISVTGPDTVITVWTGADCFSLSEVACSDPQTLVIELTGGTQYYIAISNWSCSSEPTSLAEVSVDCIALCSTCPGDVNGDSVLDGLDIQSFIDCWLAEFGMTPSPACACANANGDSLIETADVDEFVNLLLTETGICNAGSCCYDDGGSIACVVTDLAGCDGLGGLFELGADCSGDPCPVGRCCSNLGLTCNDVTELECVALGGTFDAGLNCIDDPCPLVPTNDNCVDAIEVFDGVNPYDVGEAPTLDPTAPAPCDANLVSDVWYVYTATCTGQVAMDTCDGTIADDNLGSDTVIEVFAGGTCPPVTSVACGDDTAGCGVSGFSSAVTFDVVAGQQFLIRIGEWNGGAQISGLLTIQCNGLDDPRACCFPDGSCLDQTPSDCAGNGGTSQAVGVTCAEAVCPQPPPPNDNCDGATTISQGSTPVSLNGATGSFLPACGDFPFGNDDINNDLWYSYTADCTGALFVDTCGTNTDTRLAVYDVDCIAITGGALPIECNDDHGNVDEDDNGIACTFGFSASLAVPVTAGTTYLIRVGSFATAATTISFDLNVLCAPAGGTEACCFANGGCSDEIVADCNTMGGTPQGSGTSCAIVSCPQPPPMNDDCATPMAIMCNSGPVAFSSAGATSDLIDDITSTCEVASGGPFAHDQSVWFTFTPTATTATISLCSTPNPLTQDSVMTLFGPNAICGSLVEFDCDDDFCTAPAFGPPQISATGLTVGQPYLILVDFYSGGHTDGPHSIEITCP